MGSLSVSTHRGLVHWQGLLLLVSLLTFWSPPTIAKISVMPNYVPKGIDVLLHIYNKPPEATGFAWYKGNTVDKNNIIAISLKTPSCYLSGPEHRGVEMITEDGSLLLKNVTMNDAGIYTVVVHLPDSETEIGSGTLGVYEPVRAPTLLASNTTVTENKDGVVLTCYTNELFIQWLFNNKNLNFTDRMNLTMNGRRLTIDPVKREDAGMYKCKASNRFMRVESRPLQLHVLY